jgi:hypothetical protein
VGKEGIFMIKVLLFIGIMALAAVACTPARDAAKTSAMVKQDTSDSTSYEITIIDIYFDEWYQTHYSPAKDRTNEFYRVKNNIAVSRWNYYYNTTQYTWVIDCSIDYRADIDYGMDVNRLLYWYFTYITENYKVRLW